MVTYKCLKCEKKIKDENLGKRFVCPHCGGKIFYKIRTRSKKIKAE
ncbi:MAG: DNA-directed RNA polymerase subunit P [Candidatus Pacearchaeota archaeon]